jgi:hypothetical protein
LAVIRTWWTEDQQVWLIAKWCDLQWGEKSPVELSQAKPPMSSQDKSNVAYEATPGPAADDMGRAASTYRYRKKRLFHRVFLRRKAASGFQMNGQFSESVRRRVSLQTTKFAPHRAISKSSVLIRHLS